MTQITTRADVLEYLELIYQTGQGGSRVTVLAEHAVRTVYRDLPGKHQWKYLRRRGQLVTSATYSTGTIAYDHTGGSSERMVTLTSGTWPSWAAYGVLIIDGVGYNVTSRVSDSVITLEETTNPGADVASGTAFTIARRLYPLPVAFRRIGTIFESNGNRVLRYESPSELQMNLLGGLDTGDPYCWTVRGERADYLNKSVIEFYPIPETSRSYEFTFLPEPRAFTLPARSVSSGTISMDSGGTTVTGSGTAFTDEMIGTVFRASAASNLSPTSHVGANPPIVEGIVTDVTSSTVLTIDTAAPSALSGVSWNVSDLIDIEPGTTLTYFFRQCEAELAHLLRLKDVPMLLEMATLALREAMAYDVACLDDTVTDQEEKFFDRVLGRPLLYTEEIER